MSERDHFEEGMLYAASTCEGQFPNGCGASTVDYKQSLTAPMVSGLRKVWLGTGQRHGVVLHPDKGFGLTHSEASNFNKLGYFGLAQMAFTEEGLRLSGRWFITPKGSLFASGLGYCRQHVWTWRSQPIEFDGDLVDLSSYDRTVLQAEDYARESRPHVEEPEEPDDPQQ